MDDKRVKEIRKVVEHFKGKPITDNVLTEYCNLNKIDPVLTRGSVLDYIEQVEHDTVMGEAFVEIVKELKNLKYTPVFLTEKERKVIENANDSVRVKITQILENHAIKYKYVSNATQEIAQLLNRTVESAGTTAFNRALDVLLRIAKGHFGSDLDMKQVKSYIDEVVKNLDKPKK